jgi:predicted aminopeptidase
MDKRTVRIGISHGSRLFLKLILTALVLSVLFLGIGGCSAGYILRVGYGQAKVLLHQKPIRRVLRRGKLRRSERKKLRLVLAVKKFAEEEIGLEKTRNYTTYYDTGGTPVAYNVSACPKDALKPYLWSFPIVGRLPYKGFFCLDDAKEEAEALKRQDYDTLVRRVAAYSTLGWFSDPVFSPMLRYDPPDLANLIIHELTHATIFKKGDAAFNENVATFMGNRGSVAFLRHHYGKDAQAVRDTLDALADEKTFGVFMATLHRRLLTLYASAIPREEKIRKREEIFRQAKADYRALRPRLRTTTYDYFLRITLNNAVLLSFWRYHGDLDLLEEVFVALGRSLPDTLDLFREAEKQDDPIAFLKAWLQSRKRTQLETPGSKTAK